MRYRLSYLPLPFASHAWLAAHASRDPMEPSGKA